ncbi:hypothetical protein BJX65DRAFT_198280 [Aspergillus insuetus]
MNGNQNRRNPPRSKSKNLDLYLFFSFLPMLAARISSFDLLLDTFHCRRSVPLILFYNRCRKIEVGKKRTEKVLRKKINKVHEELNWSVAKRLAGVTGKREE